MISANCKSKMTTANQNNEIIKICLQNAPKKSKFKFRIGFKKIKKALHFLIYSFGNKAIDLSNKIRALDT